MFPSTGIEPVTFRFMIYAITAERDSQLHHKGFDLLWLWAENPLNVRHCGEIKGVWESDLQTDPPRLQVISKTLDTIIDLRIVFWERHPRYGSYVVRNDIMKQIGYEFQYH